MLESSLRIGFSLVAVFALMWGIAKVVRRPLAGRSGGLLAVVTRAQLTRGSSVAVVRVGERTLIVGVTEHNVTLLGETTLDDAEAPATTAAHRSPVAAADLQQFGIQSPELAASAAPASELAAVRLAPQDPVPPAPAPQGKLAGSALSPQTWAATVSFLRERTVRR